MYMEGAKKNIPPAARAEDGGFRFLRMHELYYAAVNPPLENKGLRKAAQGHVTWHETLRRRTPIAVTPPPYEATIQTQFALPEHLDTHYYYG